MIRTAGGAKRPRRLTSTSASPWARARLSRGCSNAPGSVRASGLCRGSRVWLPRQARATGGADIEAEGTPHTVRVLLASGAAIPPARQLDRWHFAWSGQSFRGTFVAIDLADGRPGLVNQLPLDAYLYGVVSAEVSAAWPPAAQRAQAIAARGYVLGKLRPHLGYDVVAGESDQRYAGIEAETVEGRQAVDSTGGRVVTYGGALARVAYASCCGGHTADGALTWSLNLPYLRGVKDPYCAGTPAYPLERKRRGRGTRAGLRRGLGAQRHPLVPRCERAPQDRQRRRGADRQREDPAIPLGAGGVPGAQHPHCLGNRGDRQRRLTGTGFGHGVGLCQWGTRVMGQMGATTIRSLAFYFPGTQVGAA